MDNNNIRFFVIDDLHGKRQDMAKLISKVAPEAELEMFEHPVYLKRWFELQRDSGVELSRKPTFVITDHEMLQVKPPHPYQKGLEKYQITNKPVMDRLKEQWKEYCNIDGSFKVLSEFVDYLGEIFVIGQTAALDEDAVIEPSNLKIPKAYTEISNFAHHTNDRSQEQFTEAKLRKEVGKFKSLLNSAT